MSTNNPLHKFRSYSYKHILIACDSTAVAEYISNLDGEQVFKQVITQKGAGGRVPNEEQSSIDGVLVVNVPDGKYAIICNAFSDSEFYITKLSWETLLAPNYPTKTPNKDYITTVATEGTLTIVEPKGFRFLNVVNSAGVLMGCGPTGLVWIIKTVFVGLTDDTGMPNYISNIKPFAFVLIDLTASFDEGGSTYEITMVGASNGISKAPHYSQMNVNTITASETDTLQTTMSKFEKLINDTYNQKITDFVNQGVIDVENNLQRKLQYKIVLDDEYQGSDYRMDKFLSSQTGVGDRNGGVIGFGSNTDIEYMLRSIMSKCSKVVDGASQTPNRFFKIYSVFTSDNNFGYLNYYIKPMTVPTSNTDGVITEGTPFNALEFNYMYTGLNVDIVDFQIKMEHGLAFFQSMQVVGPITNDQGIQGKVPTSDASRSVTGPDKQTDRSFITPIGVSSRMLSRSVKDTLSSQEFNTALSKFATVETLEASMVIHGNPLLLNDMSTLPSEYNDTASTNTTPNTLLPNWQINPSLCKVNISMPSNNSLTGVGGAGSSFQVPFWYRGYFNILSIKHDFEMGRFTQQLNMINVPVDEPVTPPQDLLSKYQTDIQTK